MSFNAGTRFNTQSLTGSLAIVKGDAVRQLSLVVISGSCNVTGNLPFRGYDSTAIPLPTGTVLTISSDGVSALEITLEASGGTTLLIIEK